MRAGGADALAAFGRKFVHRLFAHVVERDERLPLHFSGRFVEREDEGAGFQGFNRYLLRLGGRIFLSLIILYYIIFI